MLKIATLLWDANKHSLPFSRCYGEEWVERLHRGFVRNLTRPFQLVLFTDYLRDLDPAIEQRFLRSLEPSYANCIQPYEMGEAMILVGLDTVIVGNIDHLADYCLTADKIALPRDPFRPEMECNGVALVPAGHARVFAHWQGENDMDWMRRQPHAVIDDLFPGHVASYKGRVMAHGLGDARIVYFHGQEKPHQLGHLEWINRHWGPPLPA